jgi:hypothetical protein
VKDLENHTEALIVCASTGRGSTINDMSSYVSEAVIRNEMETVRSLHKAWFPNTKGDMGIIWPQNSNNAQY